MPADMASGNLCEGGRPRQNRAFVGINTVSHEFGAVKTDGPSNDENGCHEPVDVARDWMVVLLSHVVFLLVQYRFAAIIKCLYF